MTPSSYSHAAVIAKKALRACVTRDGVVAGTHHFVDLWARDSLFATLGANASGMSDMSKKTIETFLRFQRDDGLIPFLIRRSALSLGKYFGRHTYYDTPRAQFRSSQSGGVVPDGGVMTIIAAYALDDKQFLQKHEQQLRHAIGWYKKKFGEDLITEWFQCEWADGVLKRGETLYTNILYWKALGDMGLTQKQAAIGKLIRESLWNGAYFADWKGVFRHDYFASMGNLLAIIFGLTTRKESASIVSYIKEHCVSEFTVETNDPKYPYWRIPIQNYLVGLSDYHNRGCLWLQPGILYATALAKTGSKDEARARLLTIAEKIVEYNGVYEVYEKNGTPVDRFFYRSEEPYAWSAGLYLWAYRTYFAS